ncbi:MAG: Rieske (2Fe-2S) protein, partial [Arenicellales bacterium]
MKKIEIADWRQLKDKQPFAARVSNVDLVVVRYNDNVSVLYGRCAHRGALMADGHISGDNIICGVHGWDYRFDTGVSEYNNSETLDKFSSWIEQDKVWVDQDEILAWEREHPQPYA